MARVQGQVLFKLRTKVVGRYCLRWRVHEGSKPFVIYLGRIVLVAIRVTKVLGNRMFMVLMRVVGQVV